MRKYTYLPGPVNSALESWRTLRGNGTRAELQVTESLLRQFLEELEAAQVELNQRWNGQGKSGRHANWA